MREDQVRDVIEVRASRPGAIAEAATRRRRRDLYGGSGRIMLIAADHPARGSLGVAGRPFAMADRVELLDRLMVALARPGVDGVLATADLIEDLLLLGALDDKVVIGAMNRGGLAGAAFELDDRFTGYDAATLHRMGFDGGKMLLRIDPSDPGSLDTLAACAQAVGALAGLRLMAMVEPFTSSRVDGRVRNDLSPEAMIRAIAIASGLGHTSAYTWLKLPVVDEMERVTRASTLPSLLLGGDVDPDGRDAAYERWAKALDLPNVRGLVVGRALLYPPDDDVAAAVDAAVSLL